MRYQVKGAEIKSENAAKPIAQAAKPLIDWLTQRPCSNSALDYGCGKLRYTAYLTERSKHLGITDSHIQLNRIQRINGLETSVWEYTKKRWPACSIYELDSFWQGIPDVYDFVLCANVMSAIPSPKIRARSLRALHRVLTPHGTMLVVNQHTNSYFGKVSQKEEAFTHLDGWVIRSRNGASYYGILNKDATVRLLSRFRFVVEDAWIEGQSNYVLVKRG